MKILLWLLGVVAVVVFGLLIVRGTYLLFREISRRIKDRLYPREKKRWRKS